MITQFYSKFKHPEAEFNLTSILTWDGYFSEKAVRSHLALLKAEKQQARQVWVSIQPVLQSYIKPRYSLVFSKISLPRTLRPEDVRPFVFTKLPPFIAGCLIKTFLQSAEGAKEPYYDITAQFRHILKGDLQVAGKLKGRTIFCLFTETNDVSIDVLAAEGVEILIRQLFAPYASTFKDYLGKVIIGFCIEPPDFLNCDVKNPLKLPWTPELPDYFPEDYDVLAKLPMLFYDTYESGVVQQDFWQTLTQKFAETCVARLQKWCHEQEIKLALTQPIRARTFTQNSLPLFAEADVPGVHQIKDGGQGRGQEELQPAKRLILLKSASSISAQFNKPRTLKSGFAPPPHDGKSKEVWFASQAELFGWLDDLHWEYIAGCNLLSLSNQKGKIMDSVENYIERLNYVLSHGERYRRLLIVNPISSLWVKFGSQDWRWIINELAYISEQLLMSHHDFDYVDETLMVTRGQIQHVKEAFRFVRRRKTELNIGGGIYSVLLIPPCINLQSKAVEMLQEFISAKGRLIICEPLPYLMDGMTGDYAYPLERLLNHKRTTILRGSPEEKVLQLETILDKLAGNNISIYAKPENLKAKAIIKHHRKYENLDIFLLLNTRERRVDTLLEIDGKTRLEEWSLIDGEKFDPTQWHADDKTYAELHFEAKMARLLISLVNEEDSLLEGAN